MKTITDVRYIEQYTGSNGTQIAAIFGVTPDFDDGSVLKFTPPAEEFPQQYTVNVDEWVVWKVIDGAPSFSNVATGQKLNDQYRGATALDLPDPDA